MTLLSNRFEQQFELMEKKTGPARWSYRRSLSTSRWSCVLPSCRLSMRISFNMLECSAFNHMSCYVQRKMVLKAVTTKTVSIWKMISFKPIWLVQELRTRMWIGYVRCEWEQGCLNVMVAPHHRSSYLSTEREMHERGQILTVNIQKSV